MSRSFVQVHDHLRDLLCRDFKRGQADNQVSPNSNYNFHNSIFIIRVLPFCSSEVNGQAHNNKHFQDLVDFDRAESIFSERHYRINFIRSFNQHLEIIFYFYRESFNPDLCYVFVCNHVCSRLIIGFSVSVICGIVVTKSAHPVKLRWFSRGLILQALSKIGSINTGREAIYSAVKPTIK